MLPTLSTYTIHNPLFASQSHNQILLECRQYTAQLDPEKLLFPRLPVAFRALVFQYFPCAHKREVKILALTTLSSSKYQAPLSQEWAFADLDNLPVTTPRQLAHRPWLPMDDWPPPQERTAALDLCPPETNPVSNMLQEWFQKQETRTSKYKHIQT